MCGDFCLSVAIRTLMIDAAESTAVRSGRMGIGAGIVLDSVAADEYAECRLKGAFVTGADPGFQLFETMYATREDGVRYLERHLARLRASAAWFGFVCDEARVRAHIDEQQEALPPGVAHRMRLSLDKAGAIALVAAPLAPLADEVGVLLGPEHGFAATGAADMLLRHKTTHRADYDRGWREAEAKGAFDTLFFNDRGELTEGGRSNVFVKLAGQWWTPPLSSGVLAGVMRGVLLEDAGMHAGERVLSQGRRAERRSADGMQCAARRVAGAARPLAQGWWRPAGVPGGADQNVCSGPGNEPSFTARTYASTAAKMPSCPSMKFFTKRGRLPGKIPSMSCSTST